ncbi:MAG: hypothetical protein Q9225_005179 [Loekoesia sp. 1 TL-2023]
MGRPKNGEKKSAQKIGLVSPSDSNSASTDSLPSYQPRYAHHTTSQASSSTNSGVLTVADPASLVNHDLFQDFSYHATNWNPTTLAYGQPSTPSAPCHSQFMSNTPASVYEEGAMYHDSPAHLSTTGTTFNEMYHSYVTPPAEGAPSGHLSNPPSMPRHSSQDLFARLSSIQMRLWKRRDQSKTNMTDDQGASAELETDGFIQTASDICGVAETAAAWSRDSTSLGMSSHDLESFYFQLMMSVSAALDMLTHLENLLSMPASGANESRQRDQHQTQSSCPSLVPKQSSYFDLASLKDSERLNIRLTLTTVDFYLGQMAAVLSRIDMVSKNDGLRQAAEEVVKRSQQYRQLISSELEEL